MIQRIEAASKGLFRVVAEPLRRMSRLIESPERTLARDLNRINQYLDESLRNPVGRVILLERTIVVGYREGRSEPGQLFADLDDPAEWERTKNISRFLANALNAKDPNSVHHANEVLINLILLQSVRVREDGSHE